MHPPYTPKSMFPEVVEPIMMIYLGVRCCGGCCGCCLLRTEAPTAIFQERDMLLRYRRQRKKFIKPCKVGTRFDSMQFYCCSAELGL